MLGPNDAMTNENLRQELPKAEKRNRFSLRDTMRKNDYMYLTLAFFAPFAIMYMIYLAMEIHPFGDGSVLVLDLNGQYVYFFEALRNFIYGDTSLLYSFSRSLGGEFMGIYAYYIASPFSYLVALFPKEKILEALLCILLLKTGCCGFSFGYYLHRTARKINKTAIVAFSILYALSAYAVVQQHNTMWIDALIWLPMITLGIEQLIKFGRFKLYVFSLAVCIMSNFYIGYMCCLYVIIYFFYYFYAHNEDNRNNPCGEKRHFLRSFIRIGGYSMLGVGIAMVIVATAYYGLTFGKTTFSNPTYSLGQQFDFFDLLVKFFPGSYDTVRPEGLPFVYCGLLTIILVPLYFMSRRFTVREKVMAGVVIAIFFISFNATTLDLVWHGFQRPNWLNYRYSFMLCFFLLVLAYQAYQFMEDNAPRTIVAVSAFLALFVVIAQKLEVEHLYDFEGVWFSLFCIGLYLVVLCMTRKNDYRENTSLILVILVCLEVFCAGLTNVISLDDDVYFSKYSSYVDYMAKLRPIVETVQENDQSFYRMEKTDHRKTNDNMALNMRGLSNSTSTLNAEAIQFLNHMGYSSRSHWTKYLGGTPVNDSLLGLKYIISNQDLSDYYTAAYTAGDFTAYYNPYALSLAYAVSGGINDLDFADAPNPFERLNGLVAAMLGEEELTLFTGIEKDYTDSDNCDVSYIQGHIKYAPTSTAKDANIYYTFTAPSDDEIFFYLPSEWPREVGMKVNGNSMEGFYGNETSRIVSLGSFNPGDQVRITLTIKQNELYVMDKTKFFYSVDMDAVADAFSRLAVGNYQIDADYTETHFTGTITTTAEQATVLTTIPYDEGWEVYVDGERTEIYKTLNALIAFDTVPGTHTLELKYAPKAFTYGLICTVVCSIIFIALCFIEPFWRRRFPMVPVAASAGASAADEQFALNEIAEELNKMSPPTPAPDDANTEVRPASDDSKE
ncbi:MAG: YfhO family protein [Clostridia bacterium]|nr:YfhO family protein [Clostridia bacterium]